MEIQIEESKFYGKLLGGCVYAGYPIHIFYTIKFGDLFVTFDGYMYIDESLDYKLEFTWDSIRNFTFSDSELETGIKECNFEKEFLDICYSEHMTGERILCIDDLSIFVTEQNKDSLEKFLQDLLNRIENFRIECKDYYKRYEHIFRN